MRIGQHRPATLAGLLVAFLLAAVLAACAGETDPAGDVGDAPAPPDTAEGPRTLVFAGFGGSFEDTMRDELIPMFEEAHNATVDYVSGTAATNFAQVLAAGADSEIDVIWTNDLTNMRGREQGLWADLDASIVTNIDELYDIAIDPHNQSVGQGINSFVIQYNTERFDELGLEPPKAYLDLWDPSLQGEVLLFDIGVLQSQTFLPILSSIVGEGQHDVDAGFAKLEELKPNIAGYPSNAAEAAQLFQQGAGSVTINNLARVLDLSDTGFPTAGVFAEEGGIVFLNYLNVVEKSVDNSLAQEFVNFLISEQAQFLNATSMNQGPVNRNVDLDDETASRVPYGADVIDALLQPDWELIEENLDEWTRRWNQEFLTD